MCPHPTVILATPSPQRSILCNQLERQSEQSVSAALEQVSTLCGFEAHITAVDLSHLPLAIRDAHLIANEVMHNHTLESLVIDAGGGLPVQQLKGTNPTTALDLSYRAFGLLSGVVISRLIDSNDTLTALNVRGNAEMVGTAASLLLIHSKRDAGREKRPMAIYRRRHRARDKFEQVVEHIYPGPNPVGAELYNTRLKEQHERRLRDQALDQATPLQSTAGTAFRNRVPTAQVGELANSSLRG